MYELNQITVSSFKNKYLNIEDKDIFKYNDLFSELHCSYSYKEVIEAGNYSFKRLIKNQNKDQYMNKIDNKYKYFQKSIFSNKEYNWLVND